MEKKIKEERKQRKDATRHQGPQRRHIKTNRQRQQETRVKFVRRRTETSILVSGLIQFC